MNLAMYDMDLPLSGRLQTAREQLSGLFAAGCLKGVEDETRFCLRGLEMFLLGASQDAFDLECAARLRTARETQRKE